MKLCRMADRKAPRFGERVFLSSLLGLAVLPLLPEVVLFFANRSDIKIFAPIVYYQGIVSFLLVCPALLLPRLLARIWVAITAVLLGVPTVIVGFYSVINGTRWNLTAHAALMQTNYSEARGYLESFLSPGRLAWVVFLSLGFAGCAVLNILSTQPAWRRRLLVVSAGFVIAAYGIRNALLYTKPFRKVSFADSTSIGVLGVGINMLHPVTLFGFASYNYRATHRYYLERFQQDQARLVQLAGATTISGAVSPRVIVVVIGESATRRHWSLYGYPRPTTPRLDKLVGELSVFTDVVATSVGTLNAIRNLLTTSGDSLPVFNLFSGAGYATHWISAQYNQGFDDLELSALVSSCGEQTYLSGAYDENLVPLLAKAAARPGRQLIFLNLNGSHVRYQDHYPTSHAVFSGDNDHDRLRATYDNTIHYTDTVLADMIATLRKLNESACLVHFSDHGEDVFDSRTDKYLFRDDSLATDPMYEVPFLVWLSPQFVRDNPDFAHGVAAATARPFQNRALYHSLLGLARLTHPLYDATADLFSPSFVPPERHVGAMNRIYRKSQ